MEVPWCQFKEFIVQSLSHVWLFAIWWTAACQALLSFTVSQSLIKPMSIESVMLSNHLILLYHPPFSSCPQSFPASGSFPVSWLFASSSQSIRASVSASVLPMNIQHWFPLGLTGLISLLSKGFSRVFSKEYPFNIYVYICISLNRIFVETWPTYGLFLATVI